MNRGLRYLIFVLGVGFMAVLYVWGVHGMPSFGTHYHPYRDRAIHAAVSHQTANAVSSVNFDQRVIDTLGEETIFLGSVIGGVALLRKMREDEKQEGGEPEPRTGRTVESTRFAGYVLMPLTLLVGFDVVAHGHVTPGGGFQGGVVLATGLHLLYVAGNYKALERLRSVNLFEFTEVFGALAFAGLGFSALVISGSFLANLLPFGSFGDFVSAGTVEVLNVAVGFEVTSGATVLLASFFEQALTSGGGAE